MTLLVDDDEMLLRALARLLEGACPILTARTAGHALDLVDRVGVETIISDLDLGPDSKDGLWLLTSVARRWPHVRRFMLTGSPDARARAALRDGIIDDLLIKPTGRALLLRTVTGDG